MKDDSPSYQRFRQLVDSSPNSLTTIIRCHHAIETEIHRTLNQILLYSERLELRKIPFLTKVDLLISLGVAPPYMYPFYAELNRLRNRFAHDPEAQFTEEDATRIKNVYTSCSVSLLPKNWEVNSVGRTIGLLLQTVFVNARLGFEQVTRGKASSYAMDELLRTQFPHIANPPLRTEADEFDRVLQHFAKQYLEANHPDIANED